MQDQASQFKIVDIKRALAAKEDNLGPLAQAKQNKEAFIQQYKDGKLDLDKLKKAAGPLTHRSEKWEKYATDVDTFYEFLLTKQDEKINSGENLVKENDRIIEGMKSRFWRHKIILRPKIVYTQIKEHK